MGAWLQSLWRLCLGILKRWWPMIMLAIADAAEVLASMPQGFQAFVARIPFPEWGVGAVLTITFMYAVVQTYHEERIARLSAEGERANVDAAIAELRAKDAEQQRQLDEVASQVGPIQMQETQVVRIIVPGDSDFQVPP